MKAQTNQQKRELLEKYGYKVRTLPHDGITKKRYQYSPEKYK